MKQIIFMVFLILSSSIFSQSNTDKAKAYYFQAETQYENGDSSEALEYLEEAENLLDGTNGSIEALKVKAYYKTEQFEEAQASLTNFYDNYANEAPAELQKEMSGYLVKIEQSKKEFERKKNEQEKAKVELKRSQNLNSIWTVSKSDIDSWLNDPIEIVQLNNKISIYKHNNGNKDLKATAVLINKDDEYMVFKGEYYASYNYTHKFRSTGSYLYESVGGKSTGYDRSERKNTLKTWKDMEFKYSLRDKTLKWSLPKPEIDNNGNVAKGYGKLDFTIIKGKEGYYYFDENWKLTNEINSKYYRTPVEKSDDLFKIVNFYTKTQNKQMELLTKTPPPYIIWPEAKFPKNIITLKNYSEKGTLSEEKLYIGENSYEIKKYYDDGSLSSKHQIKNNNIDGNMIWYHRNGKMRTQRYYDKGLLLNVSGVFSASGEELNYGNITEGNGSLKLYDENDFMFGYTYFSNGKEKQYIGFYKDGKSKEFGCNKCIKSEDLKIKKTNLIREVDYFANGAIKYIFYEYIGSKRKYDKIKKYHFDNMGNVSEIVNYSRNGKIIESKKY